MLDIQYRLSSINKINNVISFKLKNFIKNHKILVHFNKINNKLFKIAYKISKFIIKIQI